MTVLYGLATTFGRWTVPGSHARMVAEHGLAKRGLEVTTVYSG